MTNREKRQKKERKKYNDQQKYLSWWNKNKHWVHIERLTKIGKNLIAESPDIYAMKFDRFYRNWKRVCRKFDNEYKLGSDRRIRLHRSPEPAIMHLFDCNTLNIYMSIFDRLCCPIDDFYYRRLWDTLKVSDNKNISEKIDKLDRRSPYLKQVAPTANIVLKPMREYIKFHNEVCDIIDLIYDELQKNKVFFYNRPKTNKCMFCLKTDVEFTAEHIIPSALLGDHAMTQVLRPGIVCRTCNNTLSVFDQTFTEFLPCLYLKLILNPYVESSKRLRLPYVEFKNVILKNWGAGGIFTEILLKNDAMFDLDKDIITELPLPSTMGRSFIVHEMNSEMFADEKKKQLLRQNAKNLEDHIGLFNHLDTISWQISKDFNTMKIGTDFTDDRKYITVYPLKKFNDKSRLKLQKFLLSKFLEMISKDQPALVYLKVFDIIRDFVLYDKNFNDFHFYTISQRFWDEHVTMNILVCSWYDHNGNKITLQDIENSSSSNIDKFKFEFVFDFYGQLFFVGYGLDPLCHQVKGLEGLKQKYPLIPIVATTLP